MSLALKLELPSPHDAIVRGEEIIFWAMEEISFRVTSPTTFRKYSTGFLLNQMRGKMIN